MSVTWDVSKSEMLRPSATYPHCQSYVQEHAPELLLAKQSETARRRSSLGEYGSGGGLGGGFGGAGGGVTYGGGGFGLGG